MLQYLTVGWLVLSGCMAWGVEYPLAEAPRNVSVREVAQRQRIVCDWGRVSEVIKRTADDVDDEATAFNAWFQNGGYEELALNIQNDLSEWTHAEVTRQVEAHKAAYRTKPQPTRFLRTGNYKQEVRSVPQWLTSIPFETRKALLLLVYNDADPVQRQWVVEKAAGNPSAVVTAVGWNSEAERDAFNARYPEFQVVGVKTDDFAGYYGITELPARIVFPNENLMVIEEGVKP